MNIPDKNHKTVQNTLNLPSILVFDYLVHPHRNRRSSKFFSQPAKQKSLLMSVLRVNGLNFSPGGQGVKSRGDQAHGSNPPPFRQPCPKKVVIFWNINTPKIYYYIINAELCHWSFVPIGVDSYKYLLMGLFCIKIRFSFSDSGTDK